MPKMEVSTVGAGESGANSKARIGPDSPWFWRGLELVALLLAPIALVTYVVMVVAGQARRVRAKRMALAGLVTLFLAVLIGLVTSGPLAAVTWQKDAWLDLWGGIVHGDVSVSSVIADLVKMVPFSVPLGLWLGAAHAGWMAYRRRALTQYEGYDFERPEGILDRRARHRNTAKIERGEAIDEKQGVVAAGVGAYGRLVTFDVATTLRPTLVLGMIGSGKTTWAQSLHVQIVTMGSGICVVDFKGDDEIPAFWSEVSVHQDRKFFHFQLAPSSSAPYEAPHPDVSDQPAYYDPLVGGNATSKTNMLANSVGREGDAAAYFRAQHEMMQALYEIAHRTGYDKGRGGFQVLQEMLDRDAGTLERLVDDHTAKVGTGDPIWNGIAARARTFMENTRRDPVQAGATSDMARLLSSYQTSPALRGRLRPGPEDQTIDLMQAVLEGHIVVFSLSVQNYKEIASNVGTLVLLDIQNTITKLRGVLGQHRRLVSDPTAKAPWPRFYVAIEEFGSAGPDAVLDILNKGRDVNITATLSTQSVADIVAVDGTGVFLRRIIDQIGNFAAFRTNDGEAGQLLSDLTPLVTKHYLRSEVEFSAGVGGFGMKAANRGAGHDDPKKERQVDADVFQSLSDRQFIWIAKAINATGQERTATHVTHTFEAGPNKWYEVVSSVRVPPEVRAGQANQEQIAATERVIREARAVEQQYVDQPAEIAGGVVHADASPPAPVSAGSHPMSDTEPDPEFEPAPEQENPWGTGPMPEVMRDGGSAATASVPAAMSGDELRRAAKERAKQKRTQRGSSKVTPAAPSTGRENPEQEQQSSVQSEPQPRRQPTAPPPPLGKDGRPKPPPPPPPGARNRPAPTGTNPSRAAKAAHPKSTIQTGPVPGQQTLPDPVEREQPTPAKKKPTKKATFNPAAKGGPANQRGPADQSDKE